MQKEFNFEVHERENNEESEDHLNEHRKHFSKQCRKLFNLLMDGKELTVYSALVDHNISSLPRRFLDLTQAEIEASTQTIEGKRIKRYFMTPDQVKNNGLKFSELGNNDKIRRK